jgi:AraC-like DNA-binding protein
MIDSGWMTQDANRAIAKRDSSVSIRVVQGLVDAVVAAGVERNTFLAAIGISRTMLENEDARLARGAALQMCELALELTRDPALGLHWGESSSESTFAPLSPLIAHSVNLGAGLQTLSEYHLLIADEATYELSQAGDCMTLRLGGALLGSSVRLCRFVVEMEAVGLYRLLRMFGAEVRPREVSFAYPAPSYRTEYARIFRGIERFGEQNNSITFSRSLLNAAPPHRDAEVHRALQAIAARRVLRLTKRMPCALLLREQLVKLGPCIRYDMNQAAQALGLSVRSLRRRLSAEGESFHSVANEAAGILAKRLLTVKHKSIQEVAFDMCFADASGFHRAFKRWTGLTPREYREGPKSGKRSPAGAPSDQVMFG